MSDVKIDEQILWRAIAALSRAADYLTYRDHMEGQLKLSERPFSPLTSMVDRAHYELREALTRAESSAAEKEPGRG